MPESFTLDTSCNSARSITVTASGRILDRLPRPAAPRLAAAPAQDEGQADEPGDAEPDVDEPEPEGDAPEPAPPTIKPGPPRRATAKVLTPPARPRPATGSKPRTK